MIQASELRLGNWVETYMVLMSGSWYDKDGNSHGQDTITEPTISKKQIDVEDLKIIHEAKGLATYRPIPLTPEILIAVGFKDMDGEFCPAYQLEQVEIEILPDDSYYARIKWDKDGTSLFLADVKSLHQLQNLYFSLTNTELNYKP
jgi:hypothetical protein